MAPSVRLTVWFKHFPEIHVTQDLAEDGMSFLVEYLMSAQYLDLAPFYWRRFQDMIEAGKEFVFPNLHTLANSGWPDVYPCYYFQNSLPLQSLTVLRRLYIIDATLPPRNILGLSSIHWSRLTHIYLCDAVITLHIWFSLIRAVPNLQWAYINIRVNDLSDFQEDASLPPECTLPQLSTLCISLRDGDKDAEPFAFSVLFSGLDLCTCRAHSVVIMVGIADMV